MLDALVNAALLLLRPWYEGESAIEPERVSDKLHRPPHRPIDLDSLNWALTERGTFATELIPIALPGQPWVVSASAAPGKGSSLC